MLTITILTLFPDMFKGPFDQSIIKRAQTNSILAISYVNLRDFAPDSYKTVDEHPYGGGHGMVLRVDIVDRALQSIKKTHPKAPTILLDPQGKQYSQSIATRLSLETDLIFICAHYEGIDERIRALADEEISIGDYILTGGELPTMVLVDSITRLLPGTLKKTIATTDESFTEQLLEYPHYTRPETYKGVAVPQILLSGNHREIAKWRKEQSRIRTMERRPDLLKKGPIKKRGQS